MDEAGRAVFRAVADWAQLRREAKRTARDLKDTRSAARDLDESLGGLDKSGDTAASNLRNVGDSAKASQKDVKGLLGSMAQWSRIKAKATLGLDAARAKADIQRIKDDLAGLRVTRLGIDADTARARQELNEVQGELTRLRTQPTSAKVDADISAAERRITELKARLAGLRDARLHVDADTARAKAQLAAVGREADQLGRKRPTVKVDVDTSKLRTVAVIMGAITAVAALIGPVVGTVTALAAGLFSVAAAAAPAAGGLIGVAAAAGALAQAGGVAAIALSGVGKALKALQAKQASAGSSAASSAKQQQAAADRIAAAQRGVDRALEQRNRTAIQSREAIESAQRAVASAVESADRRIASAERDHAAAVKEVERARADLNRELDLAKQRMEDLALAAEGGALDEESALIRVQRAQQELARVRRLGGSGLDLQEAQLGVKQAEHDLKEIQTSNARITQEVEKAATAGVEGDAQVVAARERVAEATQGVQDAEEALTQSRKDARDEVADAERQLAQTIQQTAWANADAQDAVTDALREQTQAYRDAAQAADEGGAGAAADDFDKASPAAQRFARFLNEDVLPALRKVRDEIQARALPKFEDAIRIALPLLDLFGGKLGTTADIIGDLSIRGAQMMTSGPWTRDFGTILDSNNRIIETLGSGALTAMDALRILWVVSGPLAERLSVLVVNGLNAARAFLEAKRGSGELAEFMTRAGNVIEQLLRIIGNFLVALWNIGKAAQPAGQILIDSLDSVTRKFRDFTGTVEGQNKMRQFFLDAVPAVQEFGRLIVDVIRFFGNLGNDPSTARFIAQLRTELLPALDRLLTSLGQGVVPKMIEFIAKVADLIAKLGGGALVGFLTTLNGIADALKVILDIPGLGEFVRLILLLAGAGYALGLVGSALSGISAALTLLGPALQLVMWALRGLTAALMSNPILLIIGGIALAAWLIYENWDQVKKWLGEFWDWLGARAQEVWDFLVWLFGGSAVNDKWNALMDSLRAKMAEWVDWGKQKWGEFWDWASRKTDESGNWISNKTGELRDNIKATFSDAWDTAGRVVAGAWDFITGTSDQKAAIMRDILKKVGDAVGIDLVGSWDRAVRGISGFIDSIQRKIEDLISFIERQISRAESALSRLGSSVTSGLQSAARAVIPGYATGGLVGGSGNADNQIIRATAGEWVVPKEVTARFLPFLKAITFGSARSVTQIVEPAQARLIQDRLAGVPDLSQMAGLRELLTTARGASTTAVDNSDNSRGVNVVTNIYNPIAEPASDSVADRMRTLSLMGAFS